MPISEFSADIATRNLRGNRASLWPDGRKASDRLIGITKIAIKPSFLIARHDKIMTLGSCFARNIEKSLHHMGFDVPMMSIFIPAEERASSTQNDILNKYTVHSIENEINWALGEKRIPDEDMFLRVSEDLWHDPHLVHNIKPASLARVRERRALVDAAASQLPQCRIVIITLGLAEAWYDAQAKTYLNAAPPKEALSYYPGRFSLHTLNYNEILGSLERMHEALSRHGHPNCKILITVSPVPFKATFSGADALVANCYSKSVQRAACEEFASRHENVDYFPSYEIVTLTNREAAYETDNIHVTQNVVDYIMESVIKAYSPDTALKEEKEFAPAQHWILKTYSDYASIIKLHMREKEYKKAATMYAATIERFSKKLRPEKLGELRLNYGVALLRMGEPKAGVSQLKIAYETMPDNARLNYKLGLGLARSGQHEEALLAFKRTVALNPHEPDYHWRLGMQLVRLQRNSEAIRHFQDALSIKPDHLNTLEALRKVKGNTSAKAGLG